MVVVVVVVGRCIVVEEDLVWSFVLVLVLDRVGK